MGASNDEPTPMEQEEEDDEVEIDDDALEEDGSGEETEESESEEGDAEEEEEDDDAAEEAAEAERVASFVADMPEEERARLKEVVWAQSPGFKHWPAFIYHPADVNDELRKTCYRGKGNEGPKTHHIVFYYNFGSNAFAGVPFKSILPWTPENKEALEKVVKQYKVKLPGAIEAAEGDVARPKDDRNPGPPDVKAIRKQEREARRAEREQQRRERQEQRRKEKEAAKRQRRAERKRKAREEGGAGGGKKKPKKEQGGGGAAKKAKAMFATETEEERFVRLTRNLEILLGEAAENLNVAKICSTLDKLAAIRASMQLLTETGAGQLVKDLRRHDNADIQAKAKHTFATWKGSLAAPPASEGTSVAAPAEAEEAKPPPKLKKDEPAPPSSSKKPTAEECKSKGKSKGKEQAKDQEGQQPPPPPPKQELPAKPAAGQGSAVAAPAAEANPATAVEKAAPASSEAAAAAKPSPAQNGSVPAVDSDRADTEGPAAPAAFGGSDDAFADLDEAKKRQRARSLVKQVLAGGADEAAAPAVGDEAKLTAVAEQAEGLLFAHRKGRADDKYLTYVRGLCSAVKGSSHDLRARLLRGEVEPALADFLNKA